MIHPSATPRVASIAATIPRYHHLRVSCTSLVLHRNQLLFHAVSAVTTQVFDWVASQVSLQFNGTQAAVLLRSHAHFNVQIDNQPPRLLRTGSDHHASYTLATGLANSSHTITLSLRTEAKTSNRTTPAAQTPTSLAGFVLDGPQEAHPRWEPFRGKLVIVGDSISVGWGNTGECCGEPGARSEPCAQDGTRSVT